MTIKDVENFVLTREGAETSIIDGNGNVVVSEGRQIKTAIVDTNRGSKEYQVARTPF